MAWQKISVKLFSYVSVWENIIITLARLEITTFYLHLFLQLPSKPLLIFIVNLSPKITAIKIMATTSFKIIESMDFIHLGIKRSLQEQWGYKGIVVSVYGT